MRQLDQLTDLEGKAVLVRIDTDVPVQGHRVNEDYRLRAALPTIRHLVRAGATVTLIGHAGRPKGRVDQRLRLAPVAKHLAHLLVPGAVIKTELVEHESPVFQRRYRLAKQVTMLENLRFDAGEEANEPEFVRFLIEGQDLYVNESFATAHREAASTVGVAHKLPSYAGLRLVDEVAHLNVLARPSQRPFVLIVGGAKVQEKLGLLEHFLPQVDRVLTGGVVANMLLKAKGMAVKRSVVEAEYMETAERLINLPGAEKILLPTDYHWSGDRILDIGPQTIQAYQRIAKESKTIFWAGSLGMAEQANFAAGTREVAETLAHHSGVRMIGGGDTAAALQRFKLLDKMSFVSTGGGAALEYLAGKRLPGLKVLG